MVSALIHSRQPSPSSPNDQDDKPMKSETSGNFLRPAKRRRQLSKKTPFATLIVAPMTLLSHWKSELDRSSQPGTVHATIWHGSSRGAFDFNLSEDVANVVITSYGTLASEFGKRSSPLYTSMFLPSTVRLFVFLMR